MDNYIKDVIFYKEKLFVTPKVLVPAFSTMQLSLNHSFCAFHVLCNITIALFGIIWLIFKCLALFYFQLQLGKPIQI